MIPARYANVLFSLILSGLMSFLVSGIATVRAAGFDEQVFHLWFSAWLMAWLIAFPAVMVVAPVARKAVQAMVASQ